MAPPGAMGISKFNLRLGVYDMDAITWNIKILTFLSVTSTKTECDYLYDWIRQWSHTQKFPAKWWTPGMWLGRQKKMLERRQYQQHKSSYLAPSLKMESDHFSPGIGLFFFSPTSHHIRAYPPPPFTLPLIAGVRKNMVVPLHCTEHL